jgi:four helix bundle protein
MPTPVEPIRDRTFRFASEAVAVALRITPAPGVRAVVDQLVKAVTSVGANLEEAKAASSRREFVRFVEISLREAREAHYWLRIALAVNLAPEATLQVLIGEADQIIRILTAIVLSAKRCGINGVSVSAICILNSAALIS